MQITNVPPQINPAVETVAMLVLLELKVTVDATAVPAEFSGVKLIPATSPEFSEIADGLTSTWVTVLLGFEELPHWQTFGLGRSRTLLPRHVQ